MSRKSEIREIVRAGMADLEAAGATSDDVEAQRLFARGWRRLREAGYGQGVEEGDGLEGRSLLERMGIDREELNGLTSLREPAREASGDVAGLQDASVTRARAPESVAELRAMIRDAGSNPSNEERDRLKRHAVRLGVPVLIPEAWTGDSAGSGKAREAGRLLDRLGITDLDEPIDEQRLRERARARTAEHGLLDGVIGSREADLFREMYGGGE